MSIAPVASVAPVAAPIGTAAVAGTGPAKPAEGSAFGTLLERAHQSEDRSESLAERFAAGDETVGIHEVMIAAEEANVMLRVVGTLKTRALEAYRELMNTPL